MSLLCIWYRQYLPLERINVKRGPARSEFASSARPPYRISSDSFVPDALRLSSALIFPISAGPDFISAPFGNWGVFAERARCGNVGFCREKMGYLRLCSILYGDDCLSVLSVLGMIAVIDDGRGRIVFALNISWNWNKRQLFILFNCFTYVLCENSSIL